MRLPEVQRDIVNSILVAVQEPLWITDFSDRLKRENPIILEYLAKIREVVSSEAVLVGLLVYRMLESQLEANELKELFDETS